MTLGTIVGMTQANVDYFSPVYSAFTDFGTPAEGGSRRARASAACRAPTASC